jgi:hypothetical protein
LTPPNPTNFNTSETIQFELTLGIHKNTYF